MSNNLEVLGFIVKTVYTFVDKSGHVTHIDVEPLREMLARAPVVPMLCNMDAGLEACLELGAKGDLCIEEEHALKLPEDALDVPAIVGQWGDAHIIIDGSHRLWRRYKRGERDFPAYVVPERVWRLFVIHDIPGDGAFWNDFNHNAKVR